MTPQAWELGYHLRSPRNWCNDPNGCCQFRGRYHVFYQYDHDWPTVDQKAWAKFSSPDLVHWDFDGLAIEPSIAADRHGVFSGCTYVERGGAADGGDRMRVYYTGNVVAPVAGHSVKDFDFVYAGREGNTITCTSDDGMSFGPKQVLLTNADYPAECSCHVRDPRVWEQDGTRHMLLGARHKDNHGMCLVYDSDDGLTWTYRHSINPEYDFGFVWECPNIVQFGEYEYLAISPQGLPRLRDRWFNRWTPGYFPLLGRVLDTDTIDERTFVQWDYGHDFYAPQTFVDDAGRTILVGWMGTFDEHYSSVPDGLDWWHCITVPREITRANDGTLLQNPVAELAQLRGDALELIAGDDAVLPAFRIGDGRTSVHVTLDAYRADIVISGITGKGSVVLNDDFVVSYTGERLGLTYLSERGAAGRQERSVPVCALTELRILVDGSSLEIFANGGSIVFASRWFGATDDAGLTVATNFIAEHITVYPMADVMSEVFAEATVPSLTMPGWNQDPAVQELLV